jgi:hypothetical protein
MKDLDKLWVGVVEDNVDPQRLGRVKVRVQSIYDDIPLEDIPWANQLKNTSARAFEVPAIGKIISVFFPNDNIYEPYYMFADHYNINLQKKLKDLGDDEYSNFYSVVFDHRTKVYSDDTSLTMDYKYNKITVDNDNINLELKDNNRKVNIGCKTANQQAVLGNHWFDWMDKFVNTLLKPSSLIDSKGSPILKPEIEQLLIEYKAIRETFVSDHVYIVDDNKIDKLKMNYNAPYLDDNVKINNTNIGSEENNINYNQTSKDLKEKIKEQKNSTVEELKQTIPSDAKIEGQTADNPDGVMADYDTYKEIKKTEVKDITKERYDEIKNKELQNSGLDIYEAYDDPQDADEIIANMETENIIDIEAEDIDNIQGSDAEWTIKPVMETQSKEKYVDKTDESKKTNMSSIGVISCSDINKSNYGLNLKISKYFTIADLSTKTTAGSHSIPESKTIGTVTLTKYNIACNMKALCVNVLDKIKDKYPDMKINSSFRNNGGTSQHEIGQAADISFPNHSQQKDYEGIANWIKSNVNYDQLLFEFRDPSSVWIHVSYNPKGNRSISATYPKYATFLNDKTYKRLSITKVPNFSYRT